MKEKLIKISILVIYTSIIFIISSIIFDLKYNKDLELKDNEIISITKELIISKNNQCKRTFEEKENGFIIDGAYYEYKGEEK